MRNKLRFCVLAGTLFFGGCLGQPPPLTTSLASECSPTEAEIIWPQMQSVQPEQAVPDGEIKIVASGGYQIECGGFYNESHRLYKVYINQTEVGMLSCMVNHCEAVLEVPGDIQPGTHIISTEGGSQIEFKILAENSSESLDWKQEFPASAKGYELYSWFDDGEWHFTLISGTNRNKTIDEILSLENLFTPDSWVKISVEGVQDLEPVLANLPGSQEVFWLDGVRLEGTGGGKMITLPPEEIIQQVRNLCDQLELRLHIVR